MGDRIVLKRMHAALTLLLLAAVICMGVMLYRMPTALLQDAFESAPPVVVKTVPKAGDAAVDPSLSEIRVTFSKKMMDESWSWSQDSEYSFPETTGDPRYLDDGKTCVLPVKLQPGTSYLIWLNSEKYGNFKDLDGLSAVPHCLHFETRK